MSIMGYLFKLIYMNFLSDINEMKIEKFTPILKNANIPKILSFFSFSLLNLWKGHFESPPAQVADKLIVIPDD